MFEEPVEVGQVLETAFIGDAEDLFGGCRQEKGGLFETLGVDELSRRLTRCVL